jgi:beta-galactosidase
VAVACRWQGGGIYRHVWLTKRSPVHLTTWGTHVIPQVLPGTIIEANTQAQAQVQGGLQAAGFLNISAVVASDAAASSYGLSSAAPSSVASLVTATFDLIDADDTVVTSLTTAAVPVAEGGEATVEASGAVTKAVDLWTGEKLTHSLSHLCDSFPLNNKECRFNET